MNTKLQYAATKRANQFNYDYKYLVIDQDGDHYVREHLNGFNGIPADEYHGTVMRLPIPHNCIEFEGIVNGEDFDAFLNSEEATAFFKDIADHLEVYWNGRNHVGKFTKYDFTGEYPDPLEQDWLDLVSKHCSYLDASAGYWEAGDWFSNNNASDFGITASTTDEEIEAIAEEQEKDALEDHDVIVDDIEEYLLMLRDGLIESEEE